MDIRQIRYLVAAVENGSLSAAAKQHYVTVQAVSKGISELEAEVGTPLLIRGNQGVKPTAIGEAFYQRARATLASFNDLQEFTQTVPSDHSDKNLVLAFCAPSFEGGERALGKLSSLIGGRLGLHIKMIVAPGEAALASLRAGALDAVCMIGEYSAPDTDCTVVGSLPTGAGMTRRHPLAKHKSVRLADLEPYPVLWSEGFDSFNHSMLNMYLDAGLASPIIRVPVHTRSFPTDREAPDAYFISVYLSPFGKPFRDSRVVPFDKRDALSAPLCLVSLKQRKSEALIALEQKVSKVFRLVSLL